MDVVGNDFSSVQGAQDAAANLRQRQFESSFQNLMAARQFGLQNRELALRQALGTGELGLRQQQLEAERQHFAAMMEHYKNQGDVSRGYLEAYNRQIGMTAGQPSAAKVRMEDYGTGLLMQAAERGEIDSPEHAASLAPGLEPMAYQLAAARSASIRPQLAEQWNTANKVATLLTGYDHANQTIGTATAPPTINAGHWWGGADTPAVAAQKRNLQDAFVTKKHLEDNVGMPQLNAWKKSGLVIPDEDGTWHPTIPQPRWLQPTNAPVGPGAQAQAPYWSEAENPSGGAGALPLGAAPNGPAMAPPRSIAMTVPAPVAPGSNAPQAPAMGQPQPLYHPLVYQRASELSAQGIPPGRAIWQANNEFQQAQAAGSLP